MATLFVCQRIIKVRLRGHRSNGVIAAKRRIRLFVGRKGEYFYPKLLYCNSLQNRPSEYLWESFHGGIAVIWREILSAELNAPCEANAGSKKNVKICGKMGIPTTRCYP